MPKTTKTPTVTTKAKRLPLKPLKKNRQAKAPDASMTKPTGSESPIASGNAAAEGTVPPRKLPSAWSVAKAASELLWGNKKLFGGIALWYGILTLLFVGGLSIKSDAASLEASMESAGRLAGSVTGLALLLGSSGQGIDRGAAVFQLFLVLIFSLAIIWALRRAAAGTTALKIRDAFYQGMQQLVPVILASAVVVLQLLPFFVAAAALSQALANHIIVRPLEQLIFWAIFALLTSLSIYFVSASAFSIYIAALPGMTPLKALASARGLVRGRRMRIIRALVFLPFIVLLATSVILLPVIMTVTVLAPICLFVLGVLGLPFIHAYMYTLYRKLLA